MLITIIVVVSMFVTVYIYIIQTMS